MTPSDKSGKNATDGVDIVELETAFKGYFRVDRYHLRHRLFGGGWSSKISREVFERGHAVAVLLYDPLADSLVLIEQFRVGALAAKRAGQFDADFSPWLIEICAGIIDAGETAETVARREVKEETGCEVLELLPVMRYLVSPGGTSETVQLFCARVTAPPDGEIHGLDHENEDIRIRVVPAVEAMAWLDTPYISNALILVSLQWFKLHREELREWWAGASPS